MRDTGPLDIYVYHRTNEAMEVICELLNVSVTLARSANRKRKYVQARSMLAYAMRAEGMAYSQIGRYLSGRDHSTVIHMIKNHLDWMSTTDPRMDFYKRQYKIFSDAWFADRPKPGEYAPTRMDIARCRSVNTSPYIFPALKFVQVKAND